MDADTYGTNEQLFTVYYRRNDGAEGHFYLPAVTADEAREEASNYVDVTAVEAESDGTAATTATG